MEQKNICKGVSAYEYIFRLYLNVKGGKEAFTLISIVKLSWHFMQKGRR